MSGSPAVGQWWQVEFTEPLDLGPTLPVRVGSPAFHASVQSWQVVTDAGSATTAVQPGRLTQELTVPEGPTQGLRIVVDAAVGGSAGAALAEVDLPGVTPVSPDLQVRSRPGAIDLVSLRAQQLGRSACLVLGERPFCAGVHAAAAEEPTGLHRTIEIDTAAEYAVGGQVLPLDGADLEEVLREPGQIEVSASSRDVLTPYGRPDTVADGDQGTGWVAGPLDASPTLTLELPEDRELSGLRLSSDYFLPASRPHELLVSLDGGEPLELEIGDEGTVTWDETTARQVEITFGASFTVTTSDPLLPGSLRGLPVGVSEITLLGAEDLPVPDPDRQLELGCGSGPQIVVGGDTVQTRVTGTVRQVLERSRLDVAPCGEDATVELEPGPNHVVAEATDRWVPVELTLARVGSEAEATLGTSRAPTTTPLALTRPSPATLEVAVPERAEDSLVAIAQNAGAGWSADLVSADGERAALEPLVVDGWQQGFLVPAGASGTVEAQFGPDTPYRAGLGAGLLLLLALVAAALWWRPGLPVRPLAAASPGRLGQHLLVGVFALLFAGLWGVALALVAALVTRLAGRHRTTITLLVGLLGAGLLAALGPNPQGGTVGDVAPQVVVLLAILLALAGAARAQSPSLGGR